MEPVRNEKDLHTVEAPADGPCENPAVSLYVAPVTHLPCRLCHVGQRPVVRPGSSRYWDICYACQKVAMGVTW